MNDFAGLGIAFRWHELFPPPGPRRDARFEAASELGPDPWHSWHLLGFPS